MILIITAAIAFFLAGIVCGTFTLLVIGIRTEERRIARLGTTPTRSGAASRRLLMSHGGDDVPTRRMKVGQ